MARIIQRNLMWSAAALLGIAATAAIAWAASQLARQPIGLSSDPISVANGLAPALPRDSHPTHQAALAQVGTAAHPRERERRDRHHTRVLSPRAPSSPATATTVITSAWTSAPTSAGSSASTSAPASASSSASTSAPVSAGSSATAASASAGPTSAPASAGSTATAASPAAGSTATAASPARNPDDSGDGGSHRDD